MNDSTRSARQAGTRDEGFAAEGIFRLSLSNEIGPDSIIMGVATEHTDTQPPTVKYLYFTGQARPGINNRHYVVGRLKADGTADTTFGKNGIASGFFRPNAESYGTRIVVLADGKTLLQGIVGSAHTPALARLLSSGAPDTTFGNLGLVILDKPDGSQVQSSQSFGEQTQSPLMNITPLDDGRTLIVNTYNIGASQQAFIFLLDQHGNLDKSFNGKGYVEFVHPDTASSSPILQSGFIDEDGKILVCGNVRRAGETTSFLVRYMPDGSLDEPFGADGFVTLKHASGFENVIAAGNKRILGIGGTYENQGLLMSFNSDGSSNMEFNHGQPLLTQLDGNFTVWQTAVIQPDGKIVVTGSTRKQTIHTELVIARLLSDGSFDTTFNGVGWVTAQEEGISNPRSIALQVDGKIVVAGSGKVNNFDQGYVVRYLG